MQSHIITSSTICTWCKHVISLTLLETPDSSHIITSSSICTWCKHVISLTLLETADSSHWVALRLICSWSNHVISLTPHYTTYTHHIHTHHIHTPYHILPHTTTYFIIDSPILLTHKFELSPSHWETSHYKWIYLTNTTLYDLFIIQMIQLLDLLTQRLCVYGKLR